MSETTTTTEIPGAEPRRLVRLQDDRWLAGVCGGLGRYFDMSPTIYRAAFAVLAFAGGTGILLYLAAWLVIPDERSEDSIAVEAIRDRRDRPWLLFGVGLLAFAGIVALSDVHFGVHPAGLWIVALIVGAALVWRQSDRRALPADAQAGPPAPPRRSLFPIAIGTLIAAIGILGLLEAVDAVDVDWRLVLAIAAVAAGVAVAVGAATGRAVGAVAVLGVVLLIALAFAFAVRMPLFAGAGDRFEHPLLAGSFDRTYEHGVGNLTVDLSDARFTGGTSHVHARLGVGDLVVIVPYGVAVDANGHASTGTVRLFGSVREGLGVHDQRSIGASTTRHVEVDAEVGIGEVEVRRG